VLIQLYPRSLGKSELIRKPNYPTHYRDHVRLQAYVSKMCNKVTNEYGSLCKERDTWTRERVLIFIP
jgi:hypothetical protein